MGLNRPSVNLGDIDLSEVHLRDGYRDESKAHRIDPPDCGCTGCLTGRSVPLQAASDLLILQMVTGDDISDATSTEIFIGLVLGFRKDGKPYAQRLEISREYLEISRGYKEIDY